jgi:ABC-type Mn2+/Zn2+ transport system permease subunit
MVISFDPILAETLRLPSTWLRYLLLVLIAWPSWSRCRPWAWP